MLMQEMPRTRNKLTGVRYEQCDVCGGTYPFDQIMEIVGQSTAGDSEVMFRVCDDCWAGLYSGEIDPALILMDDDERAVRES